MAEILETLNNKEKSALGTTADALGGLEIASDVISLAPNPLVSAPASIVSGTFGIGRELAKYYDGTQSGYTTAANSMNHLGWALLGLIGAKGLKYGNKAAKFARTTGTSARVAEGTAKNSDELLKAWEKAEKELATAKKDLPLWKIGGNNALKERVNLARQAYENSKATLQVTTTSRFITPRAAALGAGRTVAAGALTYGVPGVEQYIVENGDGELTPGSFVNGVWYGALGNGYEQLKKDAKYASSDWDAAARLAGVFIKPHGSTTRKGPSVMRKSSKTKRTPTSTPKQLAKPNKLLETKTSILGNGFTATTAGKVQKPNTKFKKNFNGGKLEIIKELRNETNT